MELKGIKAKLVDVFAQRKLAGNGLTIFWDFRNLRSGEMQELTREMRQFESVFVERTEKPERVRARIFTMEEELDFAGHPLIGLAAHLHQEYGTCEYHVWEVELNTTTIQLFSTLRGKCYSAGMEQVAPKFVTTLQPSAGREILSALNLGDEHLAAMPMEVISTGLPYLIVPVVRGIEQARISINDFESLLSRFGAKFVYVLDILRFEGRTWDNEGRVEDIATGSAAGPAAALLYKAGLVSTGQDFQIHQGRLVDRPSTINVRIHAQGSTISKITVSGKVYPVASITFQ